jgi:hypothetical protein
MGELLTRMVYVHARIGEHRFPLAYEAAQDLPTPGDWQGAIDTRVLDDTGQVVIEGSALLVCHVDDVALVARDVPR